MISLVSCPPPAYTCACASYYIVATRMATFHRTVEEYDSEREQWPAYAERLEFYFATNDVNSPEKQRTILLSSCGPSTFQLIRNLVAPNKLSSKSFEELVDLVKAHYNPKPSAIVSHFKFYSCIRNHGETVEAFVARFCHLTEHSNYGATLKEMLRDRIVGGTTTSGSIAECWQSWTSHSRRPSISHRPMSRPRKTLRTCRHRSHQETCTL